MKRRVSPRLGTANVGHPLNRFLGLPQNVDSISRQMFCHRSTVGAGARLDEASERSGARAILHPPVVRAGASGADPPTLTDPAGSSGRLLDAGYGPADPPEVARAPSACAVRLPSSQLRVSFVLVSPHASDAFGCPFPSRATRFPMPSRLSRRAWRSRASASLSSSTGPPERARGAPRGGRCGLLRRSPSPGRRGRGERAGVGVEVVLVPCYGTIRMRERGGPTWGQ